MGKEDKCPRCERENVPIGVYSGVCDSCFVEWGHEQAQERARAKKRAEQGLVIKPLGEEIEIDAEKVNWKLAEELAASLCDRVTITGSDEGIEAYLEMTNLKETALRAKERGKDLRIHIDWKKDGQSQLRVWEENRR